MTTSRTPRAPANDAQRLHELELTMERLIERVDNLVKSVDALSETVKAQKTPLSIWLQAAAVAITVAGGMFALVFVPLADRVDRLETRVSALEAVDASSARDRMDMRRELERLHDGKGGK